MNDEKILYLNQFVTYVTAHIVITNITTYLMQEQIIFKMQSSIVLKTNKPVYLRFPEKSCLFFLSKETLKKLLIAKRKSVY